jgi:hypothetical protein
MRPEPENGLSRGFFWGPSAGVEKYIHESAWRRHLVVGQEGGVVGKLGTTDADD